LIPVGSALADKVSKIASATTDPKLRAAAALRIVQDDIRYLFSGQSAGNYEPQKPAETWEKRYGDCKAKTLLLTAMLRALGIEAEPALVNSQLGDLLPSRLPALGAFDHVLVRAMLDGKIHWLDGTLVGTRLADMADAPTFGYALPLRSGGSGLEKIVYSAPARPLVSVDKDVDATAGVALPKPYKIKLTFRNATVAVLRQAQSGLDPKKLNESIDQVVGEWFPDSIISWRSLAFDDDAGTAIVTAEGISNLGWAQADDRRVLEFSTVMSDFDLSVDRNRAAWKDIPVPTNYPGFFEFKYRLHLPKNGNGFSVENPKAITGRFGGYDMATATKFDGSVFELNESWKTSTLEMPSETLVTEREKIARARGEPIRIIAPGDYPPRWRETREARPAGLLKRLEAIYAANIAQDKDDVSGYVNRARFLDGIDDKAGMIADLSKILALQPDEGTYLWRASAYERTDPKKALADIESARAINPASPGAAELQVAIYLKQSRFDDAVATIDAALPLQTNRNPLLILKAEVLARAGKSADALVIINKANQDKPGNPDLLNGRCWVRAIANVELDAALKDCTKAIELAEQPAGMLDSRGLAYFRLQRYDEALADLDAALRLSPGQAPSLYVRGVVKSWLGATAASSQDLKDASTIYPDIAAQYVRIGVKPKG
jgi:tetratricopeptide (TPR) repeat protein